MSFLTKLPFQNSSSGYRAISLRPVSFKILVVVLALALTFGVGIYLQVASEISEKEQELVNLQNKLVSNSGSFTIHDQENFCRLMLEIKKISIPYCSKLPLNLLRNIIGLAKDDLRFLLKFSARFNPELTIRNQLKGSGQLKNFTTSPNLRGVDPDEILNKTTIDLIDFFKEKLKDRKINETQVDRIIKQLNKTMEARDLNPVQRK